MLISIILVLIVLLGIYSKGNTRVMAIAFLFLSIILFPSYVKIFSISISNFALLFALINAVLYFSKTQQFTKEIIKIFSIYILLHLLLLPFAQEMSFINQINYYIKGVFLNIIGPITISILIFSIKEINKIWKVIIIASLFICAYGVFCYITQSNIYIEIISKMYPNAVMYDFERYILEERGGLIGRISATIGHPVFYASVLISLFYIILQKFFDKKKNNIILFILLLIIINIFFSGTRSGIIALLIGIFYVFLKLSSITRKIKIFLIVTFFFLGSLIIETDIKLLNQYQSFIYSIIFFWGESDDIRGSSTSMRLDQFYGMVSILNDSSMLFGKGAGWTSYYINSHGYHPVLKGFESVLFKGIINFGIIGFFLIYGYIFNAFRKLNIKINKYRNNKDYVIIKAFLISYVIYALMTGDFYWHLFLIAIVFMLKVSLIKQEEAKQYE